MKVRFLMDHMGSRSIPGYKELVAQLDASAIEWRPMLPVRPLKGQFQRPDLRNHRKILVVDGRVAFTGSQNLIEPGYNKASNHKDNREYVELVARVDGPAARALRAVFAKDWFIEARERMGDEIVTPTRSTTTTAWRRRCSRAGPATSRRTTCGSSRR